MNPDRSNEIQWSMVGFVDDSNGLVNCFDENDITATLQHLKEKAILNATEWANLLSAKGGALELSKCSYHMLVWKLSVQGAPVLTNCTSVLQELPVRDPITNQINHLEYLPPDRAHKTFGHNEEPAGIQKMQFERYGKKRQCHKFFRITPLKRDEAWLTYNIPCYLPAVTYPLTCSHFTMENLSKIQAKAMSIITARCGYNRTTRKEIIYYGPRIFWGAGFHHLYHRQGSQQVLSLLRHWRLNSPIGLMLKCALSWAQFSIGVSCPILEVTNEPLPHMESKWIGSIRAFLSKLQGGLQLDNPGIPQPRCEYDPYILDIILASRTFTASEICRLNYCRLYLQATTLSDVTMSYGVSLDNSKLHGHPSLQSGFTRWETVNQDKLSNREWRLWQKANLL